jgi:hypothetical protein
VLLIREGMCHSIPSPGPQKRLLELDAHAALNLKKVISGDILKVRVHLAEGEYAHWEDTKRIIREKLEEHGCIVHQLVPVVTTQTRRMVSRRAVSVQSDRELLAQYAKRLKIDERTVKTGLDFLGEA